ncbi:MAG: GNAT family N-acetyltransferase [Actinobacteria bacterium]|nr:GNAT family N-acetyltransferase [Actinomycetota bacterium]
MTDTARSSVESQHGAAALQRLGTQLDELHAATATPITARRVWLQCWGRAAPEHGPWSLVVREPRGGRPVAAALLGCLQRPGWLEIGGLGQSGGGRCRLPARTPRGATALADAIRVRLGRLDQPWVLRLEHLPPTDPVAERLVATLPRVRVVPAEGIPKLLLGADRRLEAYLGKGLRKQLRRARGRIVADGVDLSVEHVRDPERITAVLGQIEAVHRRREHDRGRRSDLDTAVGLWLWRDSILQHAHRGEVEVGLLWLERELAAYTVALLDGRSYRLLDGRFATPWARYSPGRLIEAAALERLLAGGHFAELDWMSAVGMETLLGYNYVEPTVHLLAAAPSLSERERVTAAALAAGG